MQPKLTAGDYGHLILILKMKDKMNTEDGPWSARSRVESERTEFTPVFIRKMNLCFKRKIKENVKMCVNTINLHDPAHPPMQCQKSW